MQYNGHAPHPGGDGNESINQPAPASLLPDVLHRLGLQPAPGSPPQQENKVSVAAGDGAWYARAAAVRALAKLGEQAPLEPLLAAMADEHEMVRAVATHSAGLLGKLIPLESIIAALQDPAWHVREVAALALGSVSKRVPPEPLIAALNDTVAPVRVAVREALRQAHPDIDFESAPPTEASSPWKNANEVARTSPLQLPATFWQPKLETEEASVPIRLPKAQQERRQRMETNHTRIQFGKPRPAYFTTIAAVACLVLLVGSLLLTFSLVQRSKNTTSGQPTKVDTTPHLYVTSANSIFKLDLASGKVIWKYMVTDGIQFKNSQNQNVIVYPSIDTPIIVDNGMVFFGTPEHSYLYALDATSGTLRWRKAFNCGCNLTEANGVLYVTTFPPSNATIGELFAFNVRDGSELWHYQTQRSITGVAVAHGRLYLTEYNRLEALNAATGALLWKTQVPKAADEFSSEPQVVGNTLYMQYIKVYAPPGLPACYEYAFDPVKGTELWHSQRMDGVVSPVTIANGVMYFGSESGAIYALSARDGHQLWKSNAGGAVEDSPQVANGRVYVGEANYSRDPNRIVAFDATSGNLRWSKAPQFFAGDPNHPLVINNGLIYFGTPGTTEVNVFDSLHVYVLQGTDGSIVRTYKITGANPPGDPVLMIAP